MLKALAQHRVRTSRHLKLIFFWLFIANYCCPQNTTTEDCTYHKNLAWRYQLLVPRLADNNSFLLQFPFRIYKTLKYIHGRDRDSAAVDYFYKIATGDKKSS